MATHYDETTQRHTRPTSNVGAIIGWGLTILIAIAMLAMVVPEIVARYAPLWRQQPDAVVTPASPAPQLFYGRPAIEQPVIEQPAVPAPTALPTALPPAQAEHSRPAKQAPGARVQAVPAAAPAPTEAPGGIDLDTSIHIGSDGIQLGGAVSIKNAPTSGGVVVEHSRPAKQGPPR